MLESPLWLKQGSLQIPSVFKEVDMVGLVDLTKPFHQHGHHGLT